MSDNRALPPAWVADAVFYQIFPDRFAKSEQVPKPKLLEPWDAAPTFHGFKGGDLLGVQEHLDYLQDLGVNAIYFNPIFKSAANHRYHTVDYYEVDPLLGGNGAFYSLLNEAHRRGIRIVLDGVFNHVGRGFFQFNHILENGSDSLYLGWFHVNGFPLRAYETDTNPNYAAWWGLSALPKLNTSTPEVREFLWGVSRYWIEQGIDGWRLDVPSEINDDAFWLEFQRQVKGANPEAYTVGEIWGDARRWILGGQFDAAMNYLFTRACMAFFLADTLDERLTEGLSYAPVPRFDAPAFAREIENILALYPAENNQAQLNLLDSHDTARFLSLAVGDERALCLAVLFQMTYIGAPCVYYGDEIGMIGARDPDCRRGMIWDRKRWNTNILDCYRRTIRARHERVALRRGTYKTLYAQGRTVVFGRQHGAETCIVAINAGRSTKVLDVSVADYLPDGAILKGVCKNETFQVTDGKMRDLKLSPQSGRIFDFRNDAETV